MRRNEGNGRKKERKGKSNIRDQVHEHVDRCHVGAIINTRGYFNNLMSVNSTFKCKS